MMTLSNLLKNVWTWVVGVFGVVLGLLYLERTKRQQAETNLEITKRDANEAVDAYKQDQQTIEIKESEIRLHTLIANKPTTNPMTPQEVEEYWKNKK